MNRIGYITAILLAVLLCGSCINEEYAGPDPDLPTRTIIVYLGGDNNLSEETGRKIEALRQGWTYTGNKCLIYQDSRDGARLLRLRGGCRTTPTPYVETVREYGAENSASAETFARVLREVAAEYPADSYGLIFFSHASGWLPAGALQNPAPRSRSVGVDDGDAGRAEMDIAEFAAAIPGGMFDFIVFETCLTAGVEVAYELRGKSDYMLASLRGQETALIEVSLKQQLPPRQLALVYHESLPLSQAAQKFFDYFSSKSTKTTSF